MKITRVIWLKQFSEKIELKHHLSQQEVEEAFRNRPRFQFAQQGDVEEEDLYRAFGRTDAGRYLVVFFIYKRRSQALVISARDAKKRERRNYGKSKN